MKHGALYLVRQWWYPIGDPGGRSRRRRVATRYIAYTVAEALEAARRYPACWIEHAHQPATTRIRPA